MDREKIETLEQMMDELSRLLHGRIFLAEGFSADDNIADPNCRSENEFTQNSSHDFVSVWNTVQITN